MRYYVALGAREVLADVARAPDGRWNVTIDGQRHQVDLAPLDTSRAWGFSASGFSALVGTMVVDLIVQPSPDGFDFSTVGARGRARVESEWARAQADAAPRRVQEGSGIVLSPMPGRIVRVLVAPGDTVEQGAPLVVMEAMKMENELRSPRDGRVDEVLVHAGDTVEAGAKLIVLA
jgi:biotin carboxyl carrier protein